MYLYDIDGSIAALAKKKIEVQPVKTLKSGKEAQVLLVRAIKRPDTGSKEEAAAAEEEGPSYNLAQNHQNQSQLPEFSALKVYKNHELRSFNNVEKYVENWWIPSRTMKTAVRKKTRLGLQYVQDSWVNREFRILRLAYENGCVVPEPYEHVENAILMEYIGDERAPAPVLKHAKLTPESALSCMESIFESILIFFDLGYVHSDLSPFNVLWWENTPYIIDFPQAVEVRSSPKAKEYLYRDFDNIADFIGTFVNVDTREYIEVLDERCMFI